MGGIAVTWVAAIFFAFISIKKIQSLISTFP